MLAPSPVAIELIDGPALTASDRMAIIDLCSRAYDEAYGPTFNSFTGATHVVARVDDAIRSHAMVITRWIQPDQMPPLRTAYVEAVATEQAYRRRGLALAVMQRLQASLQTFELAALAPSDEALALYTRLGWQPWCGPLFTRTASGLVPTPDELVMIMRLPATPPLDLDAALSVEWRDGEVW